MEIRELFEELKSDFYTGVPDSLLRPLCDYLMAEEGISSHHIIGANEGNCVGLAAGYYMATGKVPVVYLQNSGIGNIANPVISLMNSRVYGIPCLFLIGWRGEPGVQDEPQHRFQGEITETLLKNMEIVSYVIREDTAAEELREILNFVNRQLAAGKQAALIFSAKALNGGKKMKYKNGNLLVREDAIRSLLAWAGKDVIVASTGKISREVFEVREERREGHQRDFLTVGSMGHSSSIALGIALQKPKRRIWCLDGDGALLMHMGAMALIGTSKVKNLVHVVFNNGAHESVGGFPTVMDKVDICGMARCSGYDQAFRVHSLDELEEVLQKIKSVHTLTMIEIMTAIGSRDNLGRPTISPKDNLADFMNFLVEEKE